MDNNLFFVSGLPRTGSTLLMNVLGQNPKHYVTPTSGLIEIFTGVQSTWHNPLEFQAEGLDKIKPRISNMLKGMLQGYFSEELAAGKVVFDKSRGWLQYIEDLETALDRPVKVIVPIRNIMDILISFEKLYRARDIDYRYIMGDLYGKAQTTVGRAQVLLGEIQVVGIAINRLRDALIRCPDRLLLVPFAQFASDPFFVINTIHETLDLPGFNYDFKNVKQVTHEDDTYHGMNLHVIRKDVQPLKDNDPKDWYPKWFIDEVNKAYEDINRLCK